MIKVDISETEKAIDAFFDELEKKSDRIIINAGRRAQDLIIADRSFGGNKLRHQTKLKKTEDAITVTSANKIASYIEEGTKPHVIRPRRKRALVFVVNSKLIVTKRVNHPGNKAYRFFSRATQQAYQEMQAELMSAVQGLIEKF